MRFRWSDGRGQAVEFTAADAEGLSPAAVDAAIDFRRKTARTGSDGEAIYPAARLHVHVGIAWSVPTSRRLRLRRRPTDRLKPADEPPHLPARIVREASPPVGPSDAELCRDAAARWWSMAVTAQRNARLLTWLFGDVRRMIEMALFSCRRRSA